MLTDYVEDSLQLIQFHDLVRTVAPMSEEEAKGFDLEKVGIQASAKVNLVPGC